MNPTTEKQAEGYEMTSKIQGLGDNWAVRCLQARRTVFIAHGLESRQHAEQIARDICVRYAMTERPTI